MNYQKRPAPRASVQLMTRVVQRFTPEPPPVFEGVPASIDIDEPVELYPGFEKFVKMRYFTGTPVARGPFTIDYYLSEGEAENNINRLIADKPFHKINPTKPFGFPNSHFDGTVKFYVPEDWVYIGRTLWGVITIYQG